MFFKKKRSHWKKYALVSIALASLTGTIYLSGVHAATKNNEKSLSDFETQLKDALKKNPDFIKSVLEDHPEVVLNVIVKNYERFTKDVQEHMANTEKEMTKKLEQNIAKEGDKLLSLGVVLSHNQCVPAEKYKGQGLRLALFFDPLCPHCHKLSDMLPEFLEQSKKEGLDVAINIIPIGILDEKNSKGLGRIFLATAHKYGFKVAWDLLKNVIDDAMKTAQEKKTDPEFSRDLILSHGKKLNLNMKAIEDIELSTDPYNLSQDVEDATQLFTRTEYPGVPILVGKHKDGNFSIMRIQSPGDFTKVVRLLKHGKQEAENITNQANAK